MPALQDGLILAIGNPMLDIITEVNQTFLDRFNLKNNDTILCDESRMALFDSLLELCPKFVPGGSIQNTASVFQWIINAPRVFSVLGVVGDDSEGQCIENALQNAGVDVSYRVNSTTRTAKCAVLVNGSDRSLCTWLGASKLFTKDDLLMEKERIDQAKFLYCSALFLNTSTEAVKELARTTFTSGKKLILNLGAPFVLQKHRDAILDIYSHVDIVFGNRDEVLTFAKVAGIVSQDPKEITVAMAKLPKDTPGHRLVVITQATDPVLVALGSQLQVFEAPKIPQKEIVDTNGAGDAFVGGFLAKYVQNRSLDDCVRSGNECAATIIRVFGGFPPCFQ